jgi:16S rRNA (cytidine1402-2'-O)-methyltransferase
MPGALYIVATPIGNLEDITLRALRILKEVNVIAAEDTRRTQKLLSHYDIRRPLMSYHEHNERIKAPPLVERLLRGDSVALVSDAGTPALSDPGYRLVTAAVAAGIQVVPVPGPSALTAALSAAAIPTNRFAFEGFLSAKKKERREQLQALRNERRTLICYEAPHRLVDLLRDILEIFGDRDITVAREISKVHEQFLRGRASEILQQFAGGDVKGELTLVIRGSLEERETSVEELQREIAKLRARGLRVKEIAELLGEQFDYGKREIYRLALRLDETPKH